MMKQRKTYINVALLVVIWLSAIFTPLWMKGDRSGTFSRFAQDKDTILYVDTPLFVLPSEPIRLDSVARVTIPVIDSLCIVADSTGSLDDFFNELTALRNRKDTTITIVHLGDSHIQAGFYSGRTMRLMQEQFGNAGRGWIAPFKLSKTNEPDDYFISSVIREWTTGRCIQNTRKTPIGVGGIGIRTVSPSANLDVVIAPNNGAGYQFNQAILFRSEESMPLLPAGTLKDSVEVALAAETCVMGVLADTFRVACLTDTLQLHSTRRKRGSDKLLPASSFDNVYFGFNLTNGGSGLLYHSIGVNGAMFVNYTDELYVQQLALLQPSLLIISLGTNETFGRRFNSAEFTGQIESFVALVKRYLPNTTLLFTTPPECYKRVYVNKKRTYVRNENTERAAKAIVAYAAKEGIACWDLFAATGGKSSSRKWLDKKLMGRDRVHFNKEGYYEQGILLYTALMRRYNEWLTPAEEGTFLTETETIE